MAAKAKHTLGVEHMTVLADRGYFNAPEILACEQAGIIPLVPKLLTSTAKPKAGSTSGASSTIRKPMHINIQWAKPPPIASPLKRMA